MIDFGHVWAGPYCTALLADMGAEVIKVESRHRVDIHRRQGPYAAGRPGVDRSGVWNTQNRGKRSVALNLSTERGRELARALVAESDVVVENFAPGVMDRLGLGYAALAAVRPDIVMASLSAFGQDGPQRAFVGYGPSLDAWSGLDALTAREGGPPNALGGMFPDTGSAVHAASAVLAALRDRDQSGRGCHIDVSELEVSILLLADRVCAALAGERVTATGNGDPHVFPHDCYPCDGDDAWVAVSAPDPAAWHALCAVIGRPDWAAEPSLQDAAGRRSRAPEIDAAIAAWTRSHAPLDAMQMLQEAGVPAGAAHDARSLLADPHLAARGFFREVVHPEAGAQPMYGPIWRLDGVAPPIARPAPALGGDDAYVLGAVLGLPEDERAALAVAGVAH